MEPRLSSDDWVRVALEALSEGGIDDVRVERLALRLGISNGSFYWHFRKREDLLVRVIEAWEHRQTQTVIERVDSAIAEPLERLELLTILVGCLDVRLEEAMRRWAASDMRARQAVERIYRARLAHIQSLIAAAGAPEMHTIVRARRGRFRVTGFARLAPSKFRADSEIDPYLAIIRRSATNYEKWMFGGQNF